MLEMRSVPGFDGYYVTNTGRVWSTHPWRGARGRWVQFAPSAKGYLRAGFGLGGDRKTVSLHQVVARAFLGPRPEGLEVRHLNGDKLDNRVENLKYGTHLENMRDLVEHAGYYQKRKTHCPSRHPYEGENLIVRGGRRSCRECARKAARDHWRRKNWI